MNNNQKRILEMLAEKKISVEEAERLLSLTGESPESEAPNTEVATGQKVKPKYMRVQVTPEEGKSTEHVNVRIPLSLVRAGLKLSAFIPSDAADNVNDALKQQGFDFDIRKIKGDDIEELIVAMSELEVDIHGGKEKVKVYVE